MKRFLVFHYGAYYPSGGQGDVEGDFDTLEMALASTMDREGCRRPGDFDILDMEKREWVKVANL